MYRDASWFFDEETSGNESVNNTDSNEIFSYDELFKRGYAVGLKPYEIRRFTLGELNDYIEVHTNTKIEVSITSAWFIINMLNDLIGGKFKNLERYLPKKKKIVVSSFKNKLIDKAMAKAKQLGHIK